MPYFITWEEDNVKRKVCIQTLSESIHLINKGIYNFCIEFFQYTK